MLSGTASRRTRTPGRPQMFFPTDSEKMAFPFEMPPTSW